MTQIYVTKASGEKAPFDAEKIRRTCMHAGAPPKLADKITKQVSEFVYDGISTREILKMALHLLEKELPEVAARYDLKGAIMRLGPAGFQFEELVAEILNHYGWTTRKNIYVTGGCVNHEVDIIAEKENKENATAKNNERAMIECKYHNQPGIFTGLKDALYIWARFLDLQEGFKVKRCPRFDQAWLVSNTKFSEKAITYAGCKNMRLMGWSYPHDASLKKLLEDKNLYPITILRRLDKPTQSKLAAAGFMLCSDLVKKKIEELETRTAVPQRTLKILIDEARHILTRPEASILRA